MRFRRKRVGFSRRVEPKYWQRLPLTPTWTGGNSMAAQVLFDPTLVTTGNEDARITVQRVKLSLPMALLYNTPGTDKLPIGVVFGVAILDRNVAAAPNPNFVNAYDEDTDWLALWNVFPSVDSTNGANKTLFFATPSIDIKAKRKLKMSERLLLCNTTLWSGGATNGTIDTFGSTSVLWSRSLK